MRKKQLRINYVKGRAWSLTLEGSDRVLLAEINDAIARIVVANDVIIVNSAPTGFFKRPHTIGETSPVVDLHAAEES